MRFGLRSLFVLVTALALFCGVVFGLPLLATGVVLTAVMLLSPAVWIAGASAGSEARLAFFRGGMACGLLPFALASASSGLMVMQTFSEWRSAQAVVSTVPPASYPTSVYYPPMQSSSIAPAVLNSDFDFAPAITPYSAPITAAPVATPAPNLSATLSQRLMFAGLWLTPGIFALLGGSLGYATHRLLTPRANKQSASPLESADYRVISARLTADRPTSSTTS